MRTMPSTMSRGGSTKIASMPPVGSPRCTNSHATPSPSNPPTSTMNSDSASTSVRIATPENPSVFSTASSLVRSRTDCAMVLAATRPNMKSTVEEIAIMMAPISPICFAKLSTKPFSVVVFVSADELANISSKVRLNSTDREVSAILTTYQPTSPWPTARFSSR